MCFSLNNFGLEISHAVAESVFILDFSVKVFRKFPEAVSITGPDLHKVEEKSTSCK